jgi:hypothetical protein
MNLENVGYNVWNSEMNFAMISVHNPMWKSVYATVRDSVYFSVRVSVWNSVRNSVWNSVDFRLQLPIRQERKQG